METEIEIYEREQRQKNKKTIPKTHDMNSLGIQLELLIIGTGMLGESLDKQREEEENVSCWKWFAAWLKGEK